jgi:hypothetical protein
VFKQHISRYQTAVELEVFTKLSGNKALDINEMQNMQQRPAEVFAAALVALDPLKQTDGSSLVAGNDNNTDDRRYFYSELVETNPQATWETLHYEV